MKLKSKALDTNFEFVTFEKKGDRGQPIRIILHDSLQDVIHNQVKTDIKYEYNIIVANSEHSVVVCKMWDKNGRHIEEVGESIPTTLLTKIATDYPTLIASQRAFDRAAIRYLDLPGKVFSNTEIDVSDITDVYTAPVSDSDRLDSVIDDEPTSPPTRSGIVSSVVNDVSDAILEVPEISAEEVHETNTEEPNSEDKEIEDVSEISSEATGESEEIPELDIPELDDSDIDIDVGDIVEIPEDIQKDSSNEDDLPFNDNPEAGEDDIGNYVITMRGKYENQNLTISEIYKIDRSWVEWISKNFVPRNDVAKRDVEHLKKFVASLKK